nr:MAG TPA: hypothetical protein [Caudoviricetes sp.]
MNIIRSNHSVAPFPIFPSRKALFLYHFRGGDAECPKISV